MIHLPIGNNPDKDLSKGNVGKGASDRMPPPPPNTRKDFNNLVNKEKEKPSKTAEAKKAAQSIFEISKDNDPSSGPGRVAPTLDETAQAPDESSGTEDSKHSYIADNEVESAPTLKKVEAPRYIFIDKVTETSPVETPNTVLTPATSHSLPTASTNTSNIHAPHTIPSIPVKENAVIIPVVSKTGYLSQTLDQSTITNLKQVVDPEINPKIAQELRIVDSSEPTSSNTKASPIIPPLPDIKDATQTIATSPHDKKIIKDSSLTQTIEQAPRHTQANSSNIDLTRNTQTSSSHITSSTSETVPSPDVSKSSPTKINPAVSSDHSIANKPTEVRRDTVSTNYDKQLASSSPTQASTSRSTEPAQTSHVVNPSHTQTQGVPPTTDRHNATNTHIPTQQQPVSNTNTRSTTVSHDNSRAVTPDQRDTSTRALPASNTPVDNPVSNKRNDQTIPIATRESQSGSQQDSRRQNSFTHAEQAHRSSPKNEPITHLPVDKQTNSQQKVSAEAASPNRTNNDLRTSKHKSNAHQDSNIASKQSKNRTELPETPEPVQENTMTNKFSETEPSVPFSISDEKPSNEQSNISSNLEDSDTAAFQSVAQESDYETSVADAQTALPGSLPLTNTETAFNLPIDSVESEEVQAPMPSAETFTNLSGQSDENPEQFSSGTQLTPSMISGQPQSFNFSASTPLVDGLGTANSSEANMNVSLSSEAQEVVEQLSSQLYTASSSGRVDTTVVLQHPPIFSGASVTINQQEGGGEEFNITFANLSEEAQQLILKERGALQLALEEKGFTCHIISTQHDPDAHLAQMEGEFSGEEQSQQQFSEDEQQQDEKQKPDDDENVRPFNL